MSGNTKTRNAPVRTNSAEKRKKAEKRIKNHRPEKRTMIIESNGEDITPREIFGKKLVPIKGVVKELTVVLPEIPGDLELNVISERGAHKRRDSFTISGGLTQINESVEIEAGTVLKFSVDFQGEKLEEAYVGAIIQSR